MPRRALCLRGHTVTPYPWQVRAQGMQSASHLDALACMHMAGLTRMTARVQLRSPARAVPSQLRGDLSVDSLCSQFHTVHVRAAAFAMTQDSMPAQGRAREQ